MNNIENLTTAITSLLGVERNDLWTTFIKDNINNKLLYYLTSTVAGNVDSFAKNDRLPKKINASAGENGIEILISQVGSFTESGKIIPFIQVK